MPDGASPAGNKRRGIPASLLGGDVADDAAQDTAQEAAHEVAHDGAPSFDPHVVWQMVLSELALQMPSATYDTWVRDTTVIAYEDGEFIIGMPNAYARDWLENRLRHTIKRTLSSILHRGVQVQFRVRPRPVVDPAAVESAPLYKPVIEEPQEKKGRSVVDDVTRFSTQVNPSHTFETFVVGNHNRLAHAAALAVVDSPGQVFNPLFIYGGVGLGKTHLLNAIGNSAKQRGYNMLYCSSEQFTNELIMAIRNQNTEQFRNKYRQLDILLIDDIQFIGGKESTQRVLPHLQRPARGGQAGRVEQRPSAKALATLRSVCAADSAACRPTSPNRILTRVAILSLRRTAWASRALRLLMLVAERGQQHPRVGGALNRLFMQARLTNNALTLTSPASS